MIFVCRDDGILELVADINEARRNFEGVDVEGGVYLFYDENGIFLEPEFTVPNVYTTHLFGLIKAVVSGKYNLVPAPNTTEGSFHIMLGECGGLQPNRWFSSLDEIKEHYL